MSDKHRHKHRRSSKDDAAPAAATATPAAPSESESAPKPLIRREATDADRADWTRLESELAATQALIVAARARRDAAQSRAAAARSTLDAVDAKIAAAQPASNPRPRETDDDDEPPPPPKTSSSRGIAPVAAAAAEIKPMPVHRRSDSSSSSDWVVASRAAMGSLLSNCAAASKAGADAVIFGDAARDAMLATKELLALVDEICRVKSPAEADAVRDGAAAVKERVVVLVRVGKEKLASGFLGVSPDDPAVSDAVRGVALGVKALMALLLPAAAPASTPPARAAAAVVAPARVQAPPIDDAAVAWDDVDAPPPIQSDSDSDEPAVAAKAPLGSGGGSGSGSGSGGGDKWAGAAARARQERERELADAAKKTAAARASPQLSPATTVRMPQLVSQQRAAAAAKAAVAKAPEYTSDDEDDMFGDLDDVVSGAEVVESEQERAARRAKLQAEIDAKAAATSGSKAKRFDSQPIGAAPTRQSTPPTLAPGSPKPRTPSSRLDDDDGGGSAASVADFVDEDLVAYEREKAAEAAAAAVAAMNVPSIGPRKHDRTNEQVRVTVMYVLGGLDHEGSTCEVSLGAQTRTTARAATRFGWYETIVFAREPTAPAAELRFTVRERGGKADSVGSTASRTSSHALSSLRTMVRKVEATAKRTNSRQPASAAASTPYLPVDAGTCALPLADDVVPFGGAVTKQCPLRGKANRVVGELFVYVERCEPADISRRVGVAPTVRSNENAVSVQPCRYTLARAHLTAAERNDEARGGGGVPAAEEASELDRRGDLALKYETPLQQACKWPPLGHKVIELLEAELAKLPKALEGDELRELPKKGGKGAFDIEFHNSRYQTYLHFAAEAKRADLVTRLLALRPAPNVDMRDAFGASALHIAAALNDVATIDALVQAGAAVENVSPFTGEVPLHYAAQCGSTRAIAALVDNGAAGDPVDDSGCTPLHHAAYCGERAAAATLLSTARAFLAAETRNGTTPMLLAALRGHAELSVELSGPNVAVDNAFGDTLLWGAVINADWTLCGKLIRAAGLASIDAPQLGALALSCLERVLLEQPKAEHARLVPALLLAGSSAAHRAADGKTPLHFAAYFSDAAAIKRLVTAGGNVNAADEGGNAPLHFASSVENVRALLDAGADIHQSNKEFNTPLHVARALHGEDVTRALVEKGADGSMVNENGNAARELLRVGAPPAGIYFVAPKAPLVLPSGCGGIFVPKLNEQS